MDERCPMHKIAQHRRYLLTFLLLVLFGKEMEIRCFHVIPSQYKLNS